MKKLLFLLTVAALAVMTNESALADGIQRVKVIVLDAGHGGKDVGAANGKVYEKDIALKLVLKVGALIESRMPDVKVVYTRKTDTYPTLAERVDIAHKAKGDIYLSIHVNAAGKTARGAETCIFSMVEELNKVDRGNLGTADIRNKSVIENQHSEEIVDLKNKPAASISHVNTIQFRNGESSNALAEMIQRNYKKSGRIDRGVKRGPFMVLWGIDMPSVITEVGFISNAEELQYMTSEKGQKQIAEDIYNAVAEYVGNIKAALGQSEANAADYSAADPDSYEESGPETAAGGGEARGFTVQIMASPKPISLNDSGFKSCKGKVKCYMSDGTHKYKYCAGFYSTRSEAQAAAGKLQKEFKGAFVIEVEGDRVVKK